jgi:ATP-dependent helicase/nuclease subunit A
MEDLVQFILRETHYHDFLSMQDNPPGRQANLETFMQMIRDFEATHGGGIYSFLAHFDAQEELETPREPVANSERNAVRLMSIHQSKGLEFPIVIHAELNKRFNRQDLNGSLLIDETYGLAPRIVVAEFQSHYPSLPFHLAGKKMLKELLSEEMRLLYVAFTRPVQRLVMVGTVKNFSEALEKVKPPALAGSHFDWVLHWIRQETATGIPVEQHPLFHLNLHNPGVNEEISQLLEMDETCVQAELKKLKEILQACDQPYPFIGASSQPGKASFTELKSAILKDEDLFQVHTPTKVRASAVAVLEAMEIGTAHHHFLEKLPLKQTLDMKYLRSERDRMIKETVLTIAEAECLDLDSIEKFWSSPTGMFFLQHPEGIRRELPFTCKFTLAELQELGLSTATEMREEWILVQGVIDLAFFHPNGGLWLVDFKTDRLTADEISSRAKDYEAQIRLYASALEKIFKQRVVWAGLYFIALSQFSIVCDFRGCE